MLCQYWLLLMLSFVCHNCAHAASDWFAVSRLDYLQGIVIYWDIDQVSNKIPSLTNMHYGLSELQS